MKIAQHIQAIYALTNLKRLVVYIDIDLLSQHKKEVNYWKYVLKWIVVVAKLLASVYRFRRIGKLEYIILTEILSFIF